LARRLAALLIAVAVTASGQSPCTAAAVARAAAAAPAAGEAAHHGDHATSAHAAHSGAREGPCHDASTTISPRCPCGCTGDLPHAAASASSARSAVPAPPLAEIGPGEALVPLDHRERAGNPACSPIDHVPVVS